MAKATQKLSSHASLRTSCQHAPPGSHRSCRSRRRHHSSSACPGKDTHETRKSLRGGRTRARHGTSQSQTCFSQEHSYHIFMQKSTGTRGIELRIEVDFTVGFPGSLPRRRFQYWRSIAACAPVRKFPHRNLRTDTMEGFVVGGFCRCILNNEAHTCGIVYKTRTEGLNLERTTVAREDRHRWHVYGLRRRRSGGRLAPCKNSEQRRASRHGRGGDR